MGFAPVWFAPGASRGPWLVGSSVLRFAGPDGPRARMAHPRAFAQRFTGIGLLTRVKRTVAIGEGGVLMRDQMGSAVVVWRSGATVGAILVLVRGSFTASTSEALRLAAVQQQRIENPTPPAPRAFHDPEVQLDDPGLDVPVWWLGVQLPAADRLPRLDLLGIVRSIGADRRQGIRHVLEYGTWRGRPAVDVTLMHPDALQRPGPRRELRAIRRDPCTRTARLVVPDGSGTLFMTLPRCRPGLTERAWALVRKPSVVLRLVVDSVCVRCRSPVERYATPAGMRALVRALTPRAPRAPSKPSPAP